MDHTMQQSRSLEVRPIWWLAGFPARQRVGEGIYKYNETAQEDLLAKAVSQTIIQRWIARLVTDGLLDKYVTGDNEGQ